MTHHDFQLQNLQQQVQRVVAHAWVIVAAWQSKASQARGFGGVLATLEHQPFGSCLLSLMALGLMAYSIYALVEARYRRIVN
ncbi:MAG: DUF1206 domain-containing protein [Trichocoleus desertorum ATA4-8-CV12]|jgi:hypothetical protein|nr:DUF1206 domain-containing protein [Trichocoleus desertorum ATA4-8-CV12]